MERQRERLLNCTLRQREKEDRRAAVAHQFHVKI